MTSTNNNKMNILHSLPWIQYTKISQDEYLEEFLAYRVCTPTDLLDIAKLLSKQLGQFMLLMSVCENFHCSTSLPTLTFLPIWWVWNGSEWHLIVYILLPIGLKAFFICLLAICDSSSVPILCPFFYWFFFSLLIWKSSLILVR